MWDEGFERNKQGAEMKNNARGWKLVVSSQGKYSEEITLKPNTAAWEGEDIPKKGSRGPEHDASEKAVGGQPGPAHTRPC